MGNQVFNVLTNKSAHRTPGIHNELEKLKYRLQEAGGRVVECLTGTKGIRHLAAADFLLTMPSGEVISGCTGEDTSRIGLCETMISALEDTGFGVTCVTGFSRAEKEEGLLISGASGIITDISNGAAYFCPSSRNSEDLFIELADDFCLQPVILPCAEKTEYISQVLHIGKGFALAALSSVNDGEEKEELLGMLSESGRRVVDITPEQALCGTCEVFSGIGNGGRQFTFMAGHCAESLTKRQEEELSEFTVIVKIPFLETFKATGRGTGAFVLPVELPLHTPAR